MEAILLGLLSHPVIQGLLIVFCVSCIVGIAIMVYVTWDMF